MENRDFLCEYRLKELNPELHRRVMDTGFLVVFLLEKYKNYFPDFTDHAVGHALHVIEFCNQLIGPENLEKLNAQELYVLLQGCYLHDIGMGISMRDFERFSGEVVPQAYLDAHPDARKQDLIRAFHHEFSGKLIYRYAEMLEFPSEAHTYAIAQVSRGHRKTNLYDPAEYPTDLQTPSGETVCLPYLSALIRLADEMDIGADRNSLLEYGPEHGNLHVKAHAAVYRFEVREDGFYAFASTRDEAVRNQVLSVVEKLQETLDECVDVIEKRTHFHISQRRVNLTFEP